MQTNERESRTKHSISITDRSEMSVWGVKEVLSFDEEEVRLNSSAGELCIEGEGLKIGVLDTERGVVELVGKINGFYYTESEPKEKKGFFGRIMR